MKSFTGRSFETVQATIPQAALARVAKDPQALFTDFQWFLFEGRDTVFFTAFSREAVDEAGVHALVENMVLLAPQLTHGFVGARPGEPLTSGQIDAITSIETVEDFEGYPEKWLGPSADIFADETVPLFRVMIANRKDGPDAEGRAAIIQVRSAHALLEGSDSALLTRSQSAGHGLLNDKSNKVRFGDRLGGLIGAGLMTAIHLFFAYVLSPGEKPLFAKTLAIPRKRLRDVANALEVRQRALYFALVTHALNGEGPKKAFSNKAIVATYTQVGGQRNDADDDFFRVRTLGAKFPVSNDFIAYVRAVDDAVGKIEAKDVSAMQMKVLAMFSMHRRLHKIAPWIHGPRFWRFSGTMHMVLTLVPPHRIHGPMTQGMIEPIYCGAFHPSTNICTFCPGREYVTFNLTMEARHIANAERIMPLLEQVEAAVMRGAVGSASVSETV
jgi:hypothetical protein